MSIGDAYCKIHETLPADELKSSILLVILTETEGTTNVQSLGVNGGFTA